MPNWEHDSACITLEMTTLERVGGCHLVMNVGQTHCLCVCHEKPAHTIRDTFIRNNKQKGRTQKEVMPWGEEIRPLPPIKNSMPATVFHGG